ncbi:MAG: Holliday junction branch migration protein RuvA [Candidatus Harrisonbacteria bacterium CG10_big_fil_rev_8_21_14_0_10_49_15]|uniref:Holliday junction branch migration complex subunit RuvA n=1 Tax=Candidatus Harrisonbacteria bacterium CG10_big_fil_rev_8_21_14_0_10_49_15 TaxID=1974587 RepID=A0A2H0UKB5_9BACT|nr:MAG: Holliday junction branch migration protein RuvA [Candidatus Harrisonbacteria bacterium CG10_big_fil_rev_8_21_14_0_10_49_15]
MIYSISGTLRLKQATSAVIQADCVAYRVYTSASTIAALPATGEPVEFLTHLHVREDSQELFGFLTAAELELFEALIGISGVGPRSALNVMSVAPVEQLTAAINEGRADLLKKASGVGGKTAERIVLELKGKLSIGDTGQTVGQMDADVDLEETLVGLGLTRASARAAIAKIDPELRGFNDRLKAALKKQG